MHRFERLKGIPMEANQRLDKELKVFLKGETNARFVVVSGPSIVESWPRVT